jgi:hypothetical protein
MLEMLVEKMPSYYTLFALRSFTGIFPPYDAVVQDVNIKRCKLGYYNVSLPLLLEIFL